MVMDYTAPILDLSLRSKTSSPMSVEPKFTTLDTGPSSSSPNSQHILDYSDSSDSVPSTFGNSSVGLPRPFKAYPKDPLNIAVSVATAEAFLGQNTGEVYGEFRRRMLSQVHALNTTNKNMRRYTQTCYSTSDDPNYWEKRRKNNEAAKRSRDARRAKEDEIAIRCAFLEQENLKLRYELSAFKDEVERLRTMLYK